VGWATQCDSDLPVYPRIVTQQLGILMPVSLMCACDNVLRLSRHCVFTLQVYERASCLVGLYTLNNSSVAVSLHTPAVVASGTKTQADDLMQEAL
jgi:hypothetical protein